MAETSRLLLERARASPAGLDGETRQDVGNRRRRPHSLKRRATAGNWGGGTSPHHSWPTLPRWRYLCSWRPGFVLLLDSPGSRGRRLIDFLPCPRTRAKGGGREQLRHLARVSALRRPSHPSRFCGGGGNSWTLSQGAKAQLRRRALPRSGRLSLGNNELISRPNMSESIGSGRGGAKRVSSLHCSPED